MKLPPQIWLVDDDADLRAVYQRVLSGAGYGVVHFADGTEALAGLDTDTPDLIVLDVDMPRLDGWGTIEELRRRGCSSPVLMMTGFDSVEARVRGLKLGADDYLGKLCATTEFLARVYALLRRAGMHTGGATAKPAELLRLGATTVDLAAKTATKAGAPLRLTKTDYALLALLNDHAGKPVTREEILRSIWPGSATGVQSSHALDTHLWRLRKKIGDAADGSQRIRNVPGIGYVMVLS